MVADALRRKTKQFNAEPEVKTSCVRVQYADGYHIDFAVFRRDWDPWTLSYKYEHAGSVKITISQPLKLTKSWDKLGQFTKKRAFY